MQNPMPMRTAGTKRLRQVVFSLLAIFAVVSSPRTLKADGPQLDAAVLKQAKAATVYLKVKLTNGKIYQGSGFFIDEPGLIVTNAHVLQMLDADSRKPADVEVVIHGGTPESRTLKAKVLGADRGSDLALLRVEGKDLPAPLKIGSTADLSETQQVYIFGYPFGKNLGDAITVSKSSISSLRKDKANRVRQVQLEGGLNPGNSGGPVVDAKGHVIGVSVSMVRGSGVGFAIPSELVTIFLNGRIISGGYEVPFRDGDKLRLPLNVELIDPLSRVKKLAMEVWSGNPGTPRGPSVGKQPDGLPGDSKIAVHAMNLDGKLTVEVELPALADPMHVYWYRPVITTGTGEVKWSSAIPMKLQAPVSRVPIELKYKPPFGGRQAVEMVSNGSFKIRDRDGDESAVNVDFRTTFIEAFGEKERNVIPMRMTFSRFLHNLRINEKSISSDVDIKRSLADIRFLSAKIEMDADGGLGRATEDLSHVPPASRRFLSDMSDQILQSLEIITLPLPDRKLQPKEQWKARRNFLIGNAIFAIPAQVDLIYTYSGIVTEGGKEYARMYIEGSVRGRNGDGSDATGSIRGNFLVSKETGEVMQAAVVVKADFDLAKSQARANGTLFVNLTRPAPGVNPKDVVVGPKDTPKKDLTPAPKLDIPAAELGELKVATLGDIPGRALPCLVWAEDGKGFYHLDGSGVVRLISYPELKEVAINNIGKKCSWQTLSKQGLIVIVSDAQEAWVLDPTTLKESKKIPVAKSQFVASSPKIDFAYAVEPNQRGDILTVLDVKTGKAGRQYNSRDFKGASALGAGFKSPMVSTDGKFLFAVGGLEMLSRFKLNGALVAYDDSTIRIVQGAFRGVCLSNEGNFVCAPSGGGNYGAGNYSTYIYASANLKSPAFTVGSGAYPATVGFDLKSGLVYAHGQAPLIVFDTKGTRLKEYTFEKARRISIHQFLVHPSGRKLLVVGDVGFGEKDGRLWSVDLSGTDTATPSKDPTTTPKDPKVINDPPKKIVDMPKTEATATPDGWKEKAPKSCTYTALFPTDGKFDENESSIVRPNIGQIRVFRAILVRKDGSTFITSQINLPPKLVKDTLKARQDLIRDMAIAEFNGKLLEEKRAEMAGLVGKEYLIETPNELVRFRLIGPGVQIYRILVVGSKEQVNSKDADAFFDGFKRTTRANPRINPNEKQ